MGVNHDGDLREVHEVMDDPTRELAIHARADLEAMVMSLFLALVSTLPFVYGDLAPLSFAGVVLAANAMVWWCAVMHSGWNWRAHRKLVRDRMFERQRRREAYMTVDRNDPPDDTQ